MRKSALCTPTAPPPPTSSCSGGETTPLQEAWRWTWGAEVHWVEGGPRPLHPHDKKRGRRATVLEGGCDLGDSGAGSRGEVLVF